MSVDDFKNGFGLGVLWALRQPQSDDMPRRAGEFIRTLPSQDVQQSINHIVGILVSSDGDREPTL